MILSSFDVLYVLCHFMSRFLKICWGESSPRHHLSASSHHQHHSTQIHHMSLRKAHNRCLAGFEHSNHAEWVDDFWFVQLADTQIGMLASIANNGLTTSSTDFAAELQMLQLAIDFINASSPPPTFVIVCGDLIDSFPSVSPSVPSSPLRHQQTQALHAALNGVRSDVPLLCVCGNHDVGNRPNAHTIASFTTEWGDDYFSFWVHGVRFLALNSSLYHTPDDAQELASAQHNWLLNELNSPQPANHTIVFCHIPPFIHLPTEPESYFNWKMHTRVSVLGALKQAKVGHLFCGHFHRNAGGFDPVDVDSTQPTSAESYKGIEVVVSSAVGVALQHAGPSEIDLPIELARPRFIGPDVCGLRCVYVTKHAVTHQWKTLAECHRSIQAPGNL